MQGELLVLLIRGLFCIFFLIILFIFYKECKYEYILVDGECEK